MPVASVTPPQSPPADLGGRRRDRRTGASPWRAPRPVGPGSTHSSGVMSAEPGAVSRACRRRAWLHPALARPSLESVTLTITSAERPLSISWAKRSPAASATLPPSPPARLRPAWPLPRGARRGHDLDFGDRSGLAFTVRVDRPALRAHVFVAAKADAARVHVSLKRLPHWPRAGAVGETTSTDLPEGYQQAVGGGAGELPRRIAPEGG